MNEALLTMLSMESPSTLLSMDSSVHDEDCGHRFLQPGLMACPPDINLPLSSSRDVAPLAWLPSAESLEMLDVSLAIQNADARPFSSSSKGKRMEKRSDCIWGAWFFFSHYFRPSQTDNLGLKLDQFMVQHDMENMYMWVFSKRPDNALGKMQLRSYMNGHAKFGEPQFPFSVEKGFNRSHRMQRKHYRGLSNPQCLHGLELVISPNLSFVSKEDQKKWAELTGREFNFMLPPEASDFSEWRTISCTDLDHERSDALVGSLQKQTSPKSTDIGCSTLTLSCKLTDGCSLSNFSLLKRKRKCEALISNEDECCVPNSSNSGEIPGEDFQQEEQRLWVTGLSGTILDASGPVTGAKSIYEDEKGYLIMVSLPFTDMSKLRVSWRNTATHGVVKVRGHSTALMPLVTRGERTFKLTDQNPEHCPQGEFIREISLATRIPDNAELKAFYVEESAGLEIMVPKHRQFSEEREVRVFLPPQLGKI